MGKDRDQSRIQSVDPQRTTGRTKRLLEQVQAKLGFVPNLFRVLANAPVALEGYLNFSAALAHGTLDSKIRERTALAVAESNLCVYCLIVQTVIAAEIGLKSS
jgi:AhpD family alkylhydroperoxidase